LIRLLSSSSLLLGTRARHDACHTHDLELDGHELEVEDLEERPHFVVRDECRAEFRLDLVNTLARTAFVSTHRCVGVVLYRQIGWMDGWMDGWMNGWMDSPCIVRRVVFP